MVANKPFIAGSIGAFILVIGFAGCNDSATGPTQHVAVPRLTDVIATVTREAGRSRRHTLKTSRGTMTIDDALGTLTTPSGASVKLPAVFLRTLGNQFDELTGFDEFHELLSHNSQFNRCLALEKKRNRKLRFDVKRVTQMPQPGSNVGVRANQLSATPRRFDETSGDPVDCAAWATIISVDYEMLHDLELDYQITLSEESASCEHDIADHAADILENPEEVLVILAYCTVQSQQIANQMSQLRDAIFNAEIYAHDHDCYTVLPTVYMVMPPSQSPAASGDPSSPDGGGGGGGGACLRFTGTVYESDDGGEYWFPIFSGSLSFGCQNAT